LRDSAAAAPSVDRWLARDKAAHFALSCAMVGFGYHLCHTEGEQEKAAARYTAAGAAISLGALKELRDGTKKGNWFSLKDLAADAAGIVCGVLLFTRR
jgi:uncharacterized protein YfiM (DUF2279 family)